jgi:carbon storage regulator
MLVLSRKVGQTIVVNGDITVTVIEIGRGRVQLGICAPRETTIHREEVHRRIERETALLDLQVASAAV